MEIIFMLHFSISAFMTGVIWFVQLVHYPTLTVLNREQFSMYNQMHFKPTTFLTFPFMLLELISGTWLLIDQPPTIIVPHLAINLVFIIIIWLTTMFFQVPLHFRVSKYPTKKALKKLIKTNWVRTILWTIKLFILVYTFVILIS